MNLVSNRSARKLIDAQGEQVRNHHDVLRKLVNDELITRGRVDTLEARVDGVDAFMGMTFWQRLRWLLKGWE